jgi:hypothetical protein
MPVAPPPGSDDRSNASTSTSEPVKAVPIAVLADETISASCIVYVTPLVDPDPAFYKH